MTLAVGFRVKFEQKICDKIDLEVKNQFIGLMF